MFEIEGVWMAWERDWRDALSGAVRRRSSRPLRRRRIGFEVVWFPLVNGLV